jgi:sporulation protein YlmC with PRC-barrel domain
MKNRRLDPLKDTGLAFGEGEQDIQGDAVRDASGEKVGNVVALFVDEKARRIRFLLVAGGGDRGVVGDERRLVPVEAIDRIEGDVVHLRHPRERVAFSPRYNPKFVEDASYWESVYGWYGYAPFWAGLTPGATVQPYRPVRR